MTTHGALVTVLMCVHNGGEYLDAAVSSIRAQSYTDFEFLIVNDGSTDSSIDVLDAHSKQDRRIRVLHQSNHGLIAALNRGLAEARGSLIARIDSDDIALPHRLATQVEGFQSRDTLGLLGGHIQIIDHSGRVANTQTIRFPIGQSEVKNSLYYGSPVPHPAAMMRRELVLRLGGYRSFFKHCEDYDLWLRMSEHAEIDNVDDVVLYYRQHGENVSTRNRETQLVGTFLAQAAWLMRKRGMADPVAEWSAITRETLFDVPLAADDKLPLFARWVLSMIDAINSRNIGEGEQLISWLLAHQDARKYIPTSDLARMRGKLARAAYQNGSFPASLRNACIAVAYEPALLARALRRLVFRQM